MIQKTVFMRNYSRLLIIIKILFGGLNEKLGEEDIFKPTSYLTPLSAVCFLIQTLCLAFTLFYISNKQMYFKLTQSVSNTFSMAFIQQLHHLS